MSSTWRKTFDDRGRIRWVASPLQRPFASLSPNTSCWDFLPPGRNYKILKLRDHMYVKDAPAKRTVNGQQTIHESLNNLPKRRIHGTVHTSFV